MTLQPSEIGTPQGGPLSPLLANILLDDLDAELEQRGHRFARYADDLLVLVRSEWAGSRVKASLTRWLDRKLKLPVNEQKSPVAKISEVTFLGFCFRGTKLRGSDAALDNFKHRIRPLTGRSWGVSMGYRLYKLDEYLGAGSVISVSRSITVRCPASTTGFAAVSACATGSSGAMCGPRCDTCWRWAPTNVRRSSPPSAAKATGGCRRYWRPTAG